MNATQDTPALLTATMNATDRCDRCGSQAYVSATKAPAVLLFCGHHGAAHAPALAAKGFTIVNETNLIPA